MILRLSSAGPQGLCERPYSHVGSWLCGDNGGNFLDKESQFLQVQKGTEEVKSDHKGEEMQVFSL